MVAEVRPNSPAAAAGFLPGDRFVSVDGNAGRNLRRRAAPGFRAAPATRSSSSCCATARRSTLTATPEIMEQTDALGNDVKIGVIGVVNNEELGQPRVDQLTARRARWSRPCSETGHIIERTGQFLKRFVVGREDKCQLGGPVKIADMAGTGREARLRMAGSAGRAAVGGHRHSQPSADSPARRRAPRFLRASRPSSGVRCRNGRWKRSIASGLLLVLGFMGFVFWNDLFGC